MWWVLGSLLKLSNRPFVSADWAEGAINVERTAMPLLWMSTIIWREYPLYSLWKDFQEFIAIFNTLLQPHTSLNALYSETDSSQRVNWLRPRNEYMRHQIKPSFVQTMACRLWLSEPMLDYCQLDPCEHISIEIQTKYNGVHWRTCMRKCRLRNGGHLVSPWMCYTTFSIIVTSASNICVT